MRFNKRIKLAALLLAAALMLCGCGNNAQQDTAQLQVSLPEPAESARRQILGDTALQEPASIQLYCASENSMALTTVTRKINFDQGENRVERILQELLSSAPVSGAVQAELVSLEFGGGVATVNLSLEAGVNRSDDAYLLLCASIGNTLLGLEEVEAVNILTGGRSDSLCALPLGTFVKPTDNVAALYAQVHSESDRFPSATADPIHRNALLYFPTREGNFFIPEVRELPFTDEAYADAIMSALTSGPLVRNSAFSPIPANFELLNAAPERIITDTGERLILLDFSSMLPNYLAFAGVEPWQLYGSAVLSICSFVPEIDAVRICIDGEPVRQCSIAGRDVEFVDGVMRRSDFSGQIGSCVQLYLPCADGTLTLERVEASLSQAAAASPKAVIERLLNTDAITLRFFDGEISGRDILGVAIEDHIATVNLSGRFYAACQPLSADDERLLIYSIVNSLCENADIGAVRFTVEGESVENLAQNIYLGAALLPDYGLVSHGAATDLDFSQEY